MGFKVHMISDVYGNPQYLLLPASESDIAELRKIDLNLLENSVLYGDKAYNDCEHEDRLIPKRKRKIIETTFSCMEKLMPRPIHAITKAGFELKVTLLVLAYALSRVTTFILYEAGVNYEKINAACIFIYCFFEPSLCIRLFKLL